MGVAGLVGLGYVGGAVDLEHNNPDRFGYVACAPDDIQQAMRDDNISAVTNWADANVPTRESWWLEYQDFGLSFQLPTPLIVRVSDPKTGDSVTGLSGSGVFDIFGLTRVAVLEDCGTYQNIHGAPTEGSIYRLRDR